MITVLRAVLRKQQQNRGYCTVQAVPCSSPTSKRCPAGPEGHQMFVDHCFTTQFTCGKMNSEGAEHRAGTVQGTLAFFCIRSETVIWYSLYCSSCLRHQPPRRRTQNSILSAINSQRMINNMRRQECCHTEGTSFSQFLYRFTKTAERALSWFRSSDKRLQNRELYDCSRARTMLESKNTMCRLCIACGRAQKNSYASRMSIF